MVDRVRKYDETISLDTRQRISKRYHAVTRAINKEFWNSISDTLHSLYVGSYGRNTAIDTSDIDILVELPGNLFDRYNNLIGNSQSRLLQAVRNAILNTYPKSDVRADGQVVKIHFSDGMYFEIVPAFKNWDGSTYIQIQILEEAGDPQIQKRSKTPWLKRTETVMVCSMTLVSIFAISEIRVSQAIICQASL